MAAPKTIGRYQIRDRLGHGRMGVLYLALDPAIDRLVAVKLLRVDNPEIRERFIREAQIAARLQHPHIVTVYDVGTHEGQPFIAMEYIAGETLGELIHRRAPLALIRKLELVADVCEGLAYAHKRGVVHRDVKPANLMVGRESGVVKILDFGIARTAGSNLTQVGMLIGTPNYMSPEQIAGQAVDHRSDIFAVGAVLYEVLVHRQAFTGDTPHAVLHQITSVEPAQVTAINPELDAELDAILNRAMAKAPADRYADLTAMRGDLHRVMQRLEAWQEGPTLVRDDQPLASPPRSARVGPDRARLAELRTARIATHLQSAEAALASGALEDAFTQVELGAEIDADDPGIVRLHERVRRAIDERDAARLLSEARSSLASGALTEAARAVAEAGQLAAGSPDVQLLRRELDRAVEERERVRKAQEALAEARRAAADGEFDTALRHLESVRQPDDRGSGVISEIEVARAQIEHDRAAHAQTSQARREADAIARAPDAEVLFKGAGNSEVPGGRLDLVHFSVIAPPDVRPGEPFVLAVWAHLEEQRQLVIQRALESADRRVAIHTKGPARVGHGTILTVRVRCTGVHVEPAEDTILWEGESGAALFSARAPEDVADRSCDGVAIVFANGAQVARIAFTLRLTMSSGTRSSLVGRARPHRTAFASYARDDLNAVGARIQGMQKAVPDLDVFWDVLSLRAGQRWEQELHQMVSSRDVFFLFWSEAASRSTWVEREWRFALETRGLDYIDPVPLVSPDVVPPPPELAALHFGDRLLPFATTPGAGAADRVYQVLKSSVTRMMRFASGAGSRD